VFVIAEISRVMRALVRRGRRRDARAVRLDVPPPRLRVEMFQSPHRSSLRPAQASDDFDAPFDGVFALRRRL
jgi:hypothetical protein